MKRLEYARVYLLANVHSNDLSNLGIPFGRIDHVFPLFLIVQLVRGRRADTHEVKVKRTNR